MLSVFETGDQADYDCGGVKGESEGIKAIKVIEGKFGLVVFRMGLTHLVDVGVRHLDEASVAECHKQIEAEDAENSRKGTIAVMTPAFKHDIVQCAAELAKVSIWDLFYYIKEYVTMSR